MVTELPLPVMLDVVEPCQRRFPELSKAVAVKVANPEEDSEIDPLQEALCLTKFPFPTVLPEMDTDMATEATLESLIKPRDTPGIQFTCTV